MTRLTGRALRGPLVMLFGAALFLPAAFAESGSLGLAEIQRMAVEHQPLLETQSGQVEAARQRAVAARQLPDPQLKLELLDVPADTRDAGRFNRDSFTVSQVGVMQEFPLGGKRALRGESESLKAAAGDAQLAAMTRAVRRDAGLAYLDLVHPHHAVMLVQAQLVEAQRSLDAAMIGYRSGSRGESDVQAARAAVGMLRDKQAAFQQEYAAAQENLRRWIGDAPDFIPEEPDDPQVLPLPVLIANLSHHPELVAADRDVDRAEVDSHLAKTTKIPDVDVELDYGHRTSFSDLVSLQVGIPLPIFGRNRQDRDVAAALSELDAQTAMREDLRRRLRAEVGGMYREWEALGFRIDRYQADVLSPLTKRVDAAVTEYRAGAGSFSGVLDARQALLEAQLSLLDLRLQRLRSALKLDYYTMGA